jgi:hypothetical protein
VTFDAGGPQHGRSGPDCKLTTESGLLPSARPRGLPLSTYAGGPGRLVPSSSKPVGGTLPIGR